ncbi:putative RNA recognition motif protein [Gregarina niphandrodes]|uniref:RNA recognition motif protein n=1 Tax=Gregarina niphandrodes TaxID=110365 RepID=A0A023AYZ5_GRENI|nr:putative RNA recognition motif protein [Gregarina niphandrodes]EZG43520.1 putative RNA recognition motif protein [Gregarina niphandrodes]|eukprot:XP_011133247.1 putative RNA recognition motif protein [Gregarina niphandrodes]
MDTGGNIVERHFSSFGVVERIVLPVDSHTGLPKGFSFITFTESSAVELVLSCPHVIDEVEVDCKPAFPRNSTKSLHDLAGVPGTLFKTRKLFVAGLPTTVTDSELVNHYARYGQVLSGRVIKDKRSGHSRGFGFVEFATEAAVDKTMSNFSSHHLGGKWVMSKRASMNPPKERPSSLANMLEPAVRAAVVRALSASFSVPRGYHDYDYRRGSPPRRPYHRGCYHDHGNNQHRTHMRPTHMRPTHTGPLRMLRARGKHMYDSDILMSMYATIHVTDACHFV